jgi:hypothetical protein
MMIPLLKWILIFCLMVNLVALPSWLARANPGVKQQQALGVALAAAPRVSLVALPSWLARANPGVKQQHTGQQYGGIAHRSARWNMPLAVNSTAVELRLPELLKLTSAYARTIDA